MWIKLSGLGRILLLAKGDLTGRDTNAIICDMSATITYTVDSLGFVPRLWQIWEDPVRGKLRCLRVESDKSGRATITAETLPQNWKIKEAH